MCSYRWATHGSPLCIPPLDVTALTLVGEIVLGDREHIVRTQVSALDPERCKCGLPRASPTPYRTVFISISSIAGTISVSQSTPPARIPGPSRGSTAKTPIAD